LIRKNTTVASRASRLFPSRSAQLQASEKHDPAGRGGGNSRNGTTGKTLLTHAGAVDLAVPRDRTDAVQRKDRFIQPGP
jgi:transposase-like protein